MHRPTADAEAVAAARASVPGRVSGYTGCRRPSMPSIINSTTAGAHDVAGTPSVVVADARRTGRDAGALESSDTRTQPLCTVTS